MPNAYMTCEQRDILRAPSFAYRFDCLVWRRHWVVKKTESYRNGGVDSPTKPRAYLFFGVEESLFVKVGWERCLISHAGV